jgi:hypothetical protein
MFVFEKKLDLKKNRIKLVFLRGEKSDLMRRKKTEKSKPYLLLGRTNAAHEAAP